MTDTKETALLIGAHPDDVELAMGGTLLKMIATGWRVIVADFTNGEPTPFGSVELRAQETARASAVLGVEERLCLGMPNRHLEATVENRRVLAEVIRLYRPTVLIGPHESDSHPDHAEAARLTEASRFEAKLHKTNLRGNPHWAHRLYRYHPIHTPCHKVPSFVIDVTDVWGKKVAAIEAYESQLKNRPATGINSWLDRVEVTCRYYGQLVGYRYGEPFFTASPLGSSDLSLLAGFGC